MPESRSALVSLRDRSEGAEGPWWLKDQRLALHQANLASSGPSGDEDPRARPMPPVALCCCFLLLSSFHSWFLSLHSLSLSHWEEPRAAVPPILMVWFTQSHSHEQN